MNQTKQLRVETQNYQLAKTYLKMGQKADLPLKVYNLLLNISFHMEDVLLPEANCCALAHHHISNHSSFMTGLCLTLELSQFWWMTTPNLRYVICNVSCLNDEKLLHCGCSNTCSLFPGSMLYCVCSGCLFWYTENEEFQEERRQRTHIPLVTSFYVFFWVNILHLLLETKVKLSFSLINDSAYTKLLEEFVLVNFPCHTKFSFCLIWLYSCTCTICQDLTFLKAKFCIE